MEKPQGGIFFLPKKEDWEKFSMARHSVRLNGSLVTNVERLCGVFRESVGRWRFRADGDLSPTPLDSLTHAVMTLADAYNLPTECQSLVPLQPKIDPCHAPPPPLYSPYLASSRPTIADPPPKLCLLSLL